MDLSGLIRSTLRRAVVGPVAETLKLFLVETYLASHL